MFCPRFCLSGNGASHLSLVFSRFPQRFKVNVSVIVTSRRMQNEFSTFDPSFHLKQAVGSKTEIKLNKKEKQLGWDDVFSQSQCLPDDKNMGMLIVDGIKEMLLISYYLIYFIGLSIISTSAKFYI